MEKKGSRLPLGFLGKSVICSLGIRGFLLILILDNRLDKNNFGLNQKVTFRGSIIFCQSRRICGNFNFIGFILGFILTALPSLDTNFPKAISDEVKAL